MILFSTKLPLFLGVFFVSISSFAQLTLPPSGGNQKACVTQYMGLTHVTVTYSAPSVHTENGVDRTGKIWGGLVPYGYNNLYFGISSEENPSPWRAGANENTTIEFSHDMVLEGTSVKAGKYGLFIVPSENEWEILLSTNSTSWGSFYFKPEDVAYTISVSPEENDFTETLVYEFSERKLSSSMLELKWENLAIPLSIEINDIYGLYVENIRNELKNYAGFSYMSWAEAAMFCAEHKVNLEEALEWANYAIEGKWVGQKNYTTLIAKSKVLMAMGNKEEARIYLEKAIFHPTAVIFDVHGMGRKYIANGNVDLAFDIFTWNAKAHPNAWPVNVGLMRGYSAKGDYKTALKYCKKAQKNVDPKDDLNRDNLVKCAILLKEGKDINERN